MKSSLPIIVVSYKMLVSQFSFDLPRELIATSPVRPRDAAKMLVVDKKLSDHVVRDLPSFLREGDVMVFNDTKVIPARLFGRVSGDNLKSAGPAVQVTLHKQNSQNIWQGFAKPARKLKIGSIFKIADDFYANVIEKNEGEVTLEFNVQGEAIFNLLEQYGMPPLPPYITREEHKPNAKDKDDYQTVYARNPGAVAAPTAGLHFTDELLQAIDEKGVTREFVTLHVGAGTFLPVKVKHTEDHVMHSEYGIISSDVAKRLNDARKKGGRIIAVGTTSLRLLESAADDKGVIHSFARETDIFITPGHKFKAVDILLTNFHLPESTLFMLVSAFAGMEKMQAAYKHAIEKKYRFYSYGDTSLLFNTK